MVIHINSYEYLVSNLTIPFSVIIDIIQTSSDIYLKKWSQNTLEPENLPLIYYLQSITNRGNKYL